MNEIFKDVTGYEGLYQISNLGRVKSLKYDKFMTPAISNGYQRIGFTKNSIKKFYRVHRLVAQAFIPNPDNKPFVNHKDGVRDNNVVDNLEWCTISENEQHKYEVLGYEYPKGENNKMAIKVNQYNKSGEFIKTYGCIRDAERDLVINKSNIIECCKGIRKTAGGFIWKYTDSEASKVAA